MQISAGGHFMGLLFACPSGCQSKSSYKTMVPQRVQSFPRKVDYENLSLLNIPIQQLIFLYFPTNRNLYRYLYNLLPQKRVVQDFLLPSAKAEVVL